MQPQRDGMPLLNRGPVREVEQHYASRANGNYLRGLRETRALLAELGHTAPVSYELHVPMPIGESGMLRALDADSELATVDKRTLYGNLAGLGGRTVRDVKILHRAPHGYSEGDEF